MKNFLAAFCFLWVALAPATAQDSDERIRSFDALITVNTDGSMLVKETIAITSTGESIVHGIYRDFPTSYKDWKGNSYSVLFDIVSLNRDGHSEPYHTEDLSNGVRVYFGSSTYDLPPGEHTYEFEYRTDRQLGFFKDHDELYWNVTGNAWKFPIDAVSATVLLPPEARRRATDLEGYTGDQGEKGNAYTVAYDNAGNPVFHAKDLAPSQGLTIVVGWRKGIVAEPTAAQKRAWFIADHKPEILGIGGVVLVLLYYLVVWARVGRDPKPGSIMPLYEPPDGMSPAAVRFLERMGFDDKGFTCAIIGLAAKNYLRIEQDGEKTYKLVRKGKAPSESGLSADEKALAKILFEDGSPLTLTNAKHTLLNRAQKAVENTLHATTETGYFLTNGRYVWPGVILSLAAIAVMVVTHGGQMLFIAIFMSIWLTGWSFGVYALLSSVVRAWRSARTEGVMGAGQAGFLTLFSIPFVIGECVGLGLLLWTCGVIATAIIASAMFLNVLFHHLLKAPTLAGRALMDRVEGFRMFLKAVEVDRLQTMAPPPNKTPELFERFLPYALALGVEQAWASQFSEVLAQAATAGGSTRGYSPSWYSGFNTATFSATSFTSSFGSSFSSAVSSSSTAPGSSSGGGGGGSSGGGGGGGGGGGW
ncbi:MAG TPA: DUF2207 domain-containing protein [Candidatus Angelobacter sp.]|nr:DUF2207 domain-containing protein [Candidatus Angelobacter sp.]